VYLFRKPSRCLIQLSHYDQVLTGVLPYHRYWVGEIIIEIRAGIQPPRPIDSSQGRWLQDPVWKVITTGWSGRPSQRCELSVMYHVFLQPSQQEVPHVKPGDLNAQSEGSLTIAGTPQTTKRPLEKIPPRVALPLQSLQNWESEIQRQVDEMNEVGSSASPFPKADMTAAS